jgi:hypothetical protein
MAKTFSDGLPTPEGSVRFHTIHFSTATMQGNGTSGWVDLHFYTGGNGPNYVTLLSPEGVQGIAANFLEALSLMPTPPAIPRIDLGGRLPGAIRQGLQTKTYFGDVYSLPVIQAMGVLMIRANLLDQQIIDLAAALTGASVAQATNQYYASVNMKARLDSIRSILPVSDLSDDLIGHIERALDRVKKVSDRRNDLVHARWSSRNGKHRATVYKPNARVKTAEITINEKHILEIAEAYSTAHGLLLSAGYMVRDARNAASSAAATPSSTEPES